AELQEEPGSVRCVSRMPTRRRMRRVRISTRLLALRRGLRAAETAQPVAVHRRERELLDAARDHRELRVLPPPRRGLYARRHRALGRHGPRQDRRLLGRVCLLQARGGREGAGVCGRLHGGCRRFARVMRSARVCVRGRVRMRGPVALTLHSTRAKRITPYTRGALRAYSACNLLITSSTGATSAYFSDMSKRLTACDTVPLS